LQPDFWHERWRLGLIGFHQSAVEQNLQKHWATLHIAHGGVFVPLCGKSLDLVWLRNQGMQVTGIELSAVALESLCLEQGILARRANDGLFERFESPGLNLLQGDFFRLSSEYLSQVTAVYDRAALIALPPEMRNRYVEHMTALTTPGTKTLLMTVEYPQHQVSGPPHSVDATQVEKLYGKTHSIALLGRRDILEEEVRLRSRGATEIHELCFLLTRR
jgi:thiopurine S-methyltransferase